MGRYMKDDLVGKIIAVNSFNLRRNPNIQLGDVTEEEIREWRRRPRILASDVPAVAANLAPDVLWAVESSDNLAVESAYARPRSLECTTVTEQWFAIKKMGVATGSII